MPEPGENPSSPEAGALVERIARYVDSPRVDAPRVDAPRAGGFGELALEAFAFQYARVEPYRRLCRALGASPASVGDWRSVPAVPVQAFKTLELHAAPPVEVFRSSGTTGAARSVHGHPFPDLYRRVVDRTFPVFCSDGALGERPPMLALVPPRHELPDSSLAFMIDHVLRRWGGEGSRHAFGRRGVDVEAASGWCRARRRDGRPGLVLATSFALAGWLEALEDAGESLHLPPGSAVFDTGGFKGRTRELSRGELLAAIRRRLGVEASRVVREYGMSELTSQLYTRALAGGDGDLFVAPPWVRVRVLDPETLEEAPEGAPGLVAIFDLANVGSAVHVLTEDLGAAEGEGLRLVGRAAGAELRGCSLTAERLAVDGRSA